ncbi:hypothetical protein OS493_026027 [Desmophyllum pertusum]|uniref:SET domain-containing protein n=1 Tax=Desmophyllum pertusum TaxID=174260 RepID=A0A9X0CIQ9_9CNID|nr:hypothetical protein OS493_026027 [Desmophyllum pertusum]
MQSHSVEVVETKGFFSLKAKESVSSGTFLADVWGPLKDSATPYTVQVGINEHVDPVGPLKYTNHSCQPNAKFIYESRYHEALIPTLDVGHQAFWYIVATRDIKKGEDVTFDYTTTEYEMSRGFKCLCGVENCLGEVKGFKYLSAEQKLQRKNALSPVIRKLYNNAI